MTRSRASRACACVVLAAIGAASCATADSNGNGATAQADPTARPHRHHRHRRHPAPDGTSDPGAMPTTGATGATVPTQPGTEPAAVATVTTAPGDTGATASIGTPVVNTGPTVTLAPRVVTRAGHAAVVCDGAAGLPHPRCPQCRESPDNAAIVRAFLPVERSVLECEPPANREGRLPIHATFSGAGVLLEVAFPGVAVDASMASCMGAAFCRVRTPSFRMAESVVDYDYVVMVPDPTNGG